MLRIENLVHVYPNGTRALDGVNLTLPRGMFGLLGPNGAGKTTLLRILAGVSDPSGGKVDRDAVAARIGWVPQEPAVYRRLTTRENIRLFTELEGAPDAAAATDELLARTDLAGYADRLAATLPDDDTAGLLWGDARPANVVVRDFVPAGLLDFELATLGPPELDVFWLIEMNRMRSRGQLPPGYLDERETIEAYEAEKDAVRTPAE